MAASDKKLVRSKSGLKIVALSDELASPFTIPEPIWKPDNQCKECETCRVKFDFIRRRHHCRRCGLCFCGTCCDQMVALPRMCFVDPVRQCKNCCVITKRENDFFEKHLKSLTTGGHFLVSGLLLPEESMPVYLCRLTQDQRSIRFDGDENMSSIDQIDLTSIEGLKIVSTGTDPQGNAVGTGVSVRFKDSHGETMEVQLTATDTSLRRQALVWVASLQKAMKLLYEGNIPQTP